MENSPNDIPKKSKSFRNGVFLLLALILIGLLYLTVVFNEKVPNVAVKTPQEIAFNDLPSTIKENYKPKEEFQKLQEKLNKLLDEKQKLSKELLLAQQEKKESIPTPAPTMPVAIENNSVEKKNEFIQVKEISSEPKTKKIPLAPKRINEVAKCYDMDKGSYSSSSLCKSNLIEFMNKHKNASYFEVIGIVDETEFTVFKNLENNTAFYEKLELTPHSLDIIKNFTQVGLAQHRAMEAQWLIKEHIKTNVKVYNANYNLFSNEGFRGFIIRAYK